MAGLLQTEAETYTDLWSSVDSYGAHAPGEQMLPIFLSIVNRRDGHVLDAGTGSGKGALALQRAGFRVTCVDVTDAGLVPDAKPLPFYTGSLWHSLKRCAPAGSFDWTYCTDVLEHVPPQFTMLACDQMLRVSRKGLFLSVSLVPDGFGVWAGRPLHLTVQSFLWWKESLAELGRVTDARDLHHAATFYVEHAR
jgi:SAM-dependent methyltransferase